MNEPAPIVCAPPPVWKVWANPIFLRYGRSRLRLRGLGIWLLIVLLLAGFIFFMVIETTTHRANFRPVDAHRMPLFFLLAIQGIILFALGTAQAAGGMVAERDEGVIDYQRLVPMSPLAKVLGYWLGLPVREYVLCLATLPFTAWCLWKGEVPLRIWLPLYAVFFSTAMMYHMTGLVTGTVVKNRRWAFLISIGLVFGLYTVIPQIALVGLIFFKYLTIMPVVEQSGHALMPRSAGAIVEASQRLLPSVTFFGLDLPEWVFTIFSQGSLILVFTIMLCRRWRRTESLLLGKISATVFFLWILVQLLGNALPLIEPGTIFPSRNLPLFLRWLGQFDQSKEAVALASIFGVIVVTLLWVLTNLITPSLEMQVKGWRRARKRGESRLAFLADPATAFWFVLLMMAGGTAAWFLFTRELVESRWFPGHTINLSVLGAFASVVFSAGLGFHALLEARGGRAIGLAAILVGVLPLMVASVIGAVSDRMFPVAIWIAGTSPLSAPVYAAATMLPISELPANAARALPRAFLFWQIVFWLGSGWLVVQLRTRRHALAREVLEKQDDSGLR